MPGMCQRSGMAAWQRVAFLHSGLKRPAVSEPDHRQIQVAATFICPEACPKAPKKLDTS